MNPVPSWTHKDLALVAILTVVALVLRSIGLNEGLWLDEISSLITHIRLPAWEIIGLYDTANNHILYSLLAHFSSGWFGESAWSIRLPAVVFGVATIPAAYYLGRQLGSRNEAFLASVFLVFSYHHVWFSQNARGYSGLLLGTVLASIFFIRLLSLEKPGFRPVLAYAIVAALATWIHLTAALVVIAHGITWLAVISVRAGKGNADLKPAAALSVLLAGMFSLLLYAPVLLQVWVEFTKGGAPPEKQLVWNTAGWLLAEFVQAFDNAIPGGWPAGALAILAIAAGIWACVKQGVVTVGILILPFLVTLFFVDRFIDVLFPRFFFGSTFFFLLIAVRGGFVLARTFLPMVSMRLVTAIGLIFVLATATMVPTAWQPKQDFVAALAFVNEHRVAGDAVACPGLTYRPLHSYLGMDCNKVHSITELNQLEQAHSRTWLLYSFPTRIRKFMPEVWRKIHQDYSPVTRFKATISGGDIVIMLNAPETTTQPTTHQ